MGGLAPLFAALSFAAIGSAVIGGLAAMASAGVLMKSGEVVLKKLGIWFGDTHLDWDVERIDKDYSFAWSEDSRVVPGDYTLRESYTFPEYSRVIDGDIDYADASDAYSDGDEFQFETPAQERRRLESVDYE